MPKVFVHGNPETSALWRALVESLEQRGVDDIILLSPPGFGAPIPDGFELTRLSYRDWLVSELEAIEGNVDVVAHDWGAGHLYALLAHRPDLVHTWAADIAGMIHPTYVWHDMAQQWVQPEIGEEAIAALLGGAAADRAELWEAFGMRHDVAADVAEGQDDEMGRAILGLYRSAPVSEMHALGAELAEASLPPGLVIVATEDEYAGTPEMARTMAERLSADTVTLEGLGHWWMFEGADPVADALIEHWG